MKTDCMVNKQMTTILIQVYYHHIHIYQIIYTYWMPVLYFKTQRKDTLVLKWIDSVCHMYDPWPERNAGTHHIFGQTLWIYLLSQVCCACCNAVPVMAHIDLLILWLIKMYFAAQPTDSKAQRISR